MQTVCFNVGLLNLALWALLIIAIVYMVVRDSILRRERRALYGWMEKRHNELMEALRKNGDAVIELKTVLTVKSAEIDDATKRQ